MGLAVRLLESPVSLQRGGENGSAGGDVSQMMVMWGKRSRLHAWRQENLLLQTLGVVRSLERGSEREIVMNRQWGNVS